MKLKVDVKSLTEHFESMLNRARTVDAWLNRVAYPQILKAQKQRWITEGQSEGVPWAPIQEKTRRSKLKRFRDYPGGGRQSLIATGRLAFSMTLDGNLTSAKAGAGDHYKMVSRNRLETGTFVPYAKYVEEGGRDITTLGEETRQKLVKNLNDYLMKGSLGLIR